jgi:hypothetical protein
MDDGLTAARREVDLIYSDNPRKLIDSVRIAAHKAVALSLSNLSPDLLTAPITAWKYHHLLVLDNLHTGHPYEIVSTFPVKLPDNGECLIKSARTFIEQGNSQSKHEWRQQIRSIKVRAMAQTDGEINYMKHLLIYAAWTIAVTALLIIAVKYVCSRKEYQLILSKFGNRKWAKTLLKSGTFFSESTAWSVRRAWTDALKSFSEEDLTEAIEGISSLPGFSKLEFPELTNYDSTQMDTDSPMVASFVLKTERAGLSQGGDIIQKALVKCATGDYFALLQTKNHPLTKSYHDIAGLLSLDHRFIPGALAGVGDRVRIHEEMDDWLAKLIEASPNDTLCAVIDIPNAPYVEKTMNTTSQLRRRADAVVTKILHRGVKRSNGEILLRARVLSSDASESHAKVKDL